jgi:hypothetical protein
MDVNRAMIGNLMEPLAAASRLEHVTLLQGTKAYGPHAGPRVLLPAREREPRDPHENFYWLQEDYLRETASTAGFALPTATSAPGGCFGRRWPGPSAWRRGRTRP